jgi:hypothetical protein
MDKFPERPGNVRSIPCNGSPRAATESPEFIWNCQVGDNTPPAGVLDADNPFDQPGALNSIPRDSQPDATSQDARLDWAMIRKIFATGADYHHQLFASLQPLWGTKSDTEDKGLFGDRAQASLQVAR